MVSFLINSATYLPSYIQGVNIFINTSISIPKNNYIYNNSDFIIV